MSRGYLLDQQLDRVLSGARLRQPQRASLRVVHRLVRELSDPISELAAKDIAHVARELNPAWTFPEGYASLTFALATGVGKTRLIGAIAAYLYRSGESRNFVIVAPRDAVLRKLQAEASESSPKYIFVDRGLVPQPRLCTRGNLLEFDPRPRSDGFLPSGPNLFVLSPQLLTVEGRIAQISPFLGFSMLEYLRNCSDLVVFVDESHHVDGGSSEEEAKAWGRAVRELRPKLAFATTGTPRDGVAIGYSYDLRQALRDRLYTKGVRLIVDEEGASYAELDYDRFTLDAGLERLKVKERAIAKFREKEPSFPKIKPVLLVCAHDQAHADQVYQWLIDQRGIDKDEILLIHSRHKTEQDLENLTHLDRPENKVRIVVQVHVLDEGWDVTNVYVIAPLRNMSSFINARQVMGRGLRLPAGRRVDQKEIDTLDILAFGQETLAEIVAQATREFGPDADVSVTNGETSDRKTDEDQGPAKNEEEEDSRSDEKGEIIKLATSFGFQYCEPDFLPPEPDMEAKLDVRSTASARTAVDIATMDTEAIEGEFSLSREQFVRVASDTIFEEFDALSAPLHEGAVKALVEILAGPAIGKSVVALDPIEIGKTVVAALRENYLAREPQYQPTDMERKFQARDGEIRVPKAYREPFSQNGLVWDSRYRRLPIGGWQRCAHVAARFDSEPEFKLANLIDKMSEVRLWLRNDPYQFRIETMAPNARMYAPDFIVLVGRGRSTRVLFVEVKGEHLWKGPSSDGQLHAKGAALWVAAANAAIGDNTFDSCVILGPDVDQVETIADLGRFDSTPRTLPRTRKES